MHIVPVYAGLLALVFTALSVRTLRLRRRLGIALGDAGHPAMLRAVRAHSNFAEYVPMSLFLFYLVEQSGADPRLVHALAGALLAGRILHAVGVSRVDERFAFRVAGMTLTLAPLLAAGIRLVWTHVPGGA